MKTMKNVLAICMIWCLTTLTCQAQVNLPERFRADINFMVPQSQAAKAVNDYGFSLSGDTLNAYLPYMGEVYTAVRYDGGLNFTAPITKLERKQKKDAEVLTFEAKNGFVNYKFKVTAYDNHHVDVEVTPSNAQFISYRGNWEEWPRE